MRYYRSVDPDDTLDTIPSPPPDACRLFGSVTVPPAEQEFDLAAEELDEP